MHLGEKMVEISTFEKWFFTGEMAGWRCRRVAGRERCSGLRCDGFTRCFVGVFVIKIAIMVAVGRASSLVGC